jgi:hypothetical protein
MSANVLAFRLGSFALLCVLSGRAFAAETILLMPLELSGGLDANRADLESAVAKGLSVAGRPVLRADDASSGTYVVSGNVGREGSTFSASFLLLRASDRQVLNSQSNNCDVADCSVGELVRRSARELVRLSLGRAQETPPPVVAPIAVNPQADTGPSSRPTLLGALSIGAGAVAVGVGAYLIAVDGDCTSTVKNHTCKNLNSTRIGGIASVAGGVAAGALGIYLLVHDDSKNGGLSLAVGARPSGLAVAGRF